jgi:phenylpyruvate tautomerase PptA (4-oxalocrotonate tautomerase family)
MPLVRVSLLEGASDSFKNKVGDSIHQALVETIQIPRQDRFQVFTVHSKSGFFYDAEYLNINRTDRLVIIQITISFGRSLEVKKALYKRIVDLLLQSVQLRPEDVFINIEETQKENWSFGNGIAQYVT